MKYILLLLLILGINSCSDKVIQLPETTNKNITEVLDVSPVYLFYHEEKDSVEFNRKNVISTTNWLVNVDKRLSLKQVMPHIVYLQNKRKKAGMHKNDAARNYFSCSNTDIQNLSFIDFTGINYVLEQPETESYSAAKNILINNLDDIQILSRERDAIKTNMSTFLDSLQKTTLSNQIIGLNFNESLSFQDYISIKSELLKLDANAPTISITEIIYN